MTGDFNVIPDDLDARPPRGDARGRADPARHPRGVAAAREPRPDRGVPRPPPRPARALQLLGLPGRRLGPEPRPPHRPFPAVARRRRPDDGTAPSRPTCAAATSRATTCRSGSTSTSERRRPPDSDTDAAGPPAPPTGAIPCAPIPLGRHDTISEIMLGTMTFGTQTAEADAHAQIEMAIDAGVTWLDTAEMYPVNPVRPETVGPDRGDHRQLDRRGATPAASASPPSIRARAARRATASRSAARRIPRAIEGSLKRLRADHVDLYQFHWPNRGSLPVPQDTGPTAPRATAPPSCRTWPIASARWSGRWSAARSAPSACRTNRAWGMARWIDQDRGDGPVRPVVAPERVLAPLPAWPTPT